MLSNPSIQPAPDSGRVRTRRPLPFIRSQRLRLALRRLASRAARAALRLRSQPYPVDEDVVTLVVAPHQDDATLGCGCLLARKRLEGVTVRVVYVTDGSGSHPGHPTLTPERLAEQRRDEARRATAVLGVEQAGLRFVDAPDGRLDQLAPGERDAIVARLAAVIAEADPGQILLPCRRDGSSEHDAAFRLVGDALRVAGLRPRILEYPVWSWWNPRLLIRPLLRSRRIWRTEGRGYGRIKRRAVAAYVSQIRATPPWTDPVLAPDFVALFLDGDEYLFESE